MKRLYYLMFLGFVVPYYERVKLKEIQKNINSSIKDENFDRRQLDANISDTKEEENSWKTLEKHEHAHVLTIEAETIKRKNSQIKTEFYKLHLRHKVIFYATS